MTFLNLVSLGIGALLLSAFIFAGMKAQRRAHDVEPLDVENWESLLESQFPLPVDRTVARRLVRPFDSLPAPEAYSGTVWQARCKAAAIWMSGGDLDTLKEVAEWGFSDPCALITVASNDMRAAAVRLRKSPWLYL